MNRRHHCRQCGNLVCGACSTGRAVLPHSTDGKPLRVCDECQPPPVTPVTVGVSGVAISAPTFSHGTSEHAVVSQIMRNTAGLTNSLSSSALTRTPSRMGIKPPSNPLPLTPLQMATGQSPASPISPTSLKTTKPIPPVPAASLKRSNTVGGMQNTSHLPSQLQLWLSILICYYLLFSNYLYSGLVCINRSSTTIATQTHAWCATCNRSHPATTRRPCAHAWR